VKQCAVAQTHLVKLALPSLFNDVLGKGCPHEFALLFRKMSPAGLDGLPRAIECGHQDTDGARIKDVIAEEVAHLRSPSRGGYIALYFLSWRDGRLGIVQIIEVRDVRQLVCVSEQAEDLLVDLVADVGLALEGDHVGKARARRDVDAGRLPRAETRRRGFKARVDIQTKQYAARVISAGRFERRALA
jgi:hypothetical protein